MSLINLTYFFPRSFSLEASVLNGCPEAQLVRFSSERTFINRIHGGYDHLKFQDDGTGHARYLNYTIKLKRDGTPDMRDSLNKQLFGKYLINEKGQKVFLYYKSEKPLKDQKTYNNFIN